jgi:hypothetical protein
MAYDVLKGAVDGTDWSCGIDDDSGDEPDTYIPFIISPSDANRIVDKAVSEEQQAVDEISRAHTEGKISEPQWLTFKRYHEEFHNWLASTGSRPYGKMKLGTVGIYKAAYEHRKRINDWRELAAKSGAASVGPKTRGAFDKKPDDSTSLWKWVAVAAAGAAGVMIVVNKV